MADIELDNVTKVYGDGTVAVKGVSLTIADGQFVVLVGPSGCGKSTLLRMIGGLERVSDGEIRVNERVVNGVAAADRDMAMVFQNYALYPHMSVFDNMGFSLKVRRVARHEIAERVHAAASMLGLTEQLRKKPRALSGGQRQRVAMGRAIVREPQAFLMDEPLSNLDAKLRVQMRDEIARLQQRLGVTTVYVTHDQTEAMTLGSVVAVLRDGVIQQLAEPRELFERPANLFVAGFVGSPPMNLIEAQVEHTDGDVVVHLGTNRLTLPADVVARRPALRGLVGRKIVVGFRAEDTEDSLIAPAAHGAVIRAEVERKELMGREAYVHFTIDAPPVVTDDTRELAGDPSMVSDLEAGRRAGQTRCVGRVSGRSRVEEGERIALALDVSSLYFFDLATGLPIEEHGRARG